MHTRLKAEKSKKERELERLQVTTIAQEEANQKDDKDDSPAVDANNTSKTEAVLASEKGEAIKDDELGNPEPAPEINATIEKLPIEPKEPPPMTKI